MLKHCVGRNLAALMVGISVSACGAVDNFEPRALQYNQEAAATKSNTILLNILRAAHRLPLQFTEYTTAVGQSSLNGQISASLPVATIPSNVARTFGITPQLAGNAQSQLTIQNLNSQEFYYGLHTPLTQQMMATFLGVGYDPEVVFLLSISSLKRTSAFRTDRLDNDPTDPIKFIRFWDAMKLLLLAGLSFETTQGPARGIGPVLSADEAKQLLPHYIKATADAAAGGAANSIPELKQKGAAYQLTKSSSVFRICFRKEKLDELRAQPNADVHVTIDGRKTYTLHLQLRKDRTSVEKFDMKVALTRLCGVPLDTPAPKSDGILVDWDFEPRSVAAIYNYLGRIVRAGWTNPEVFQNAYQLPRDYGAHPFFLFRVEDGFVPGAVFRASVGSTYSILPDNGYDQNKSTQVISLLTDLWALEVSAKTFPATSTISVTTQ
jgi:hypothetical protein